MKLSDFDFDLPKSLIAQFPSEKRTDSRLLVAGDDIVDAIFSELDDFLRADDLLVLNDTRVIPARLFGQKESGGKVEILIERLLSDTQALAMIKASRAPKISSFVVLENGQRAEVIDKSCGLYTLLFSGTAILDCLNEVGHVPLPPYIERSDKKEDLSRYQTVYAQNDGAVAAPTAGLHFDEALLAQLQTRGIEHTFVTLHVGAGTFQPVKVEHIKDHHMHSEVYQVSAEAAEKIKQTRANGGRIIAVGTTAVRTLESMALKGEVCETQGDTDIFIYPGFEFQLVDVMITNFHLPKSSLLMLVSAFISREKMFEIYNHAIDNKYRFFSYGDAMLLEKQ
jgi:S-adenosylmethionine:tRNA ribosyltransferase-isomerase